MNQVGTWEDTVTEAFAEQPLCLSPSPCRLNILGLIMTTEEDLQSSIRDNTTSNCPKPIRQVINPSPPRGSGNPQPLDSIRN